MAHSEPLNPRCLCDRSWATAEVFDQKNISQGKFCARCEREELKRLEEQERSK